MNIERNLNLVVPVERADGVTVYVHAAPLSSEAFDQYFDVIAKTFTVLFSGGYGVVSGPRIAAKMLRKVAESEGQPDSGLFAEMRRLTSVVAPGSAGWTALPVQIALDQKMIASEDVEEAENAIAFFIVSSAMHKRKISAAIMDKAVELWSAQITSSNSTVFAASLSTSTQDVATGPKAVPSSIPS